MDPATLAALQAGAGLLGSASGGTASTGPAWQGLHFGSYGSIGSPGLFTGAAAGGSAGGGAASLSGPLMLAAGAALLWVMLRKKGR